MRVLFPQVGQYVIRDKGSLPLIDRMPSCGRCSRGKSLPREGIGWRLYEPAAESRALSSGAAVPGGPVFPAGT
jgi:hypothetical protein